MFNELFIPIVNGLPTLARNQSYRLE